MSTALLSERIPFFDPVVTATCPNGWQVRAADVCMGPLGLVAVIEILDLEGVVQHTHYAPLEAICTLYKTMMRRPHSQEGP
jgi:hypothetical protein